MSINDREDDSKGSRHDDTMTIQLYHYYDVTISICYDCIENLRSGTAELEFFPHSICCLSGNGIALVSAMLAKSSDRIFQGGPVQLYSILTLELDLGFTFVSA